jgi:anti-sigma factor RsiW
VLLADGELTEDAAREVRSHVSGCDHCAATLLELEKLQEMLTPAAAATTNPTMAESRFWRSFEADLALRVTRNATPFWKRAIVLPVPAAVTMGVAVFALGAMVLQLRGEVNRLAHHTSKLEASIKTQEGDVVIHQSPELAESLALMNDTVRARTQEIRRVMAAPMPAKTMVPRDAFKIPAPYPTPDVPANMELRFVDSGSADFY